MSLTTLMVTAEALNRRLDSYVTDVVGMTVSRSYIQKLIDDGKILVNNKTEPTKYKIHAGDVITIDIPSPKDFSKESLPIIYEDKNVLVINKPSGILTHAKGAPLDEFTVGEFMRTRTTDQPEGNRPGIVHRLDRDTSGVIICAKNEITQSFLQKQFSERKVKKMYTALISGIPKQAEALLRLPIERNPSQPQMFRVGKNGKPSETTYRVAEVINKNACIVELKPLTGRTHQLRVHMAYIDCPIVGDRFYGKVAVDGGRLCLHAASLEITIPGGVRKTFTAPLPADIISIIDEQRVK